MTSPAHRRRQYAAVFLLALATLMLEVLLTRITSVVAWYHMAFFIISIAMLGMTAGAVAVFAAPKHFTDEQVPRRMAQGALAFAGLTPLVISATLSLPLQGEGALGGFLGLLIYALLLAAPFTAAGVGLTLALTRAGLPEGTVYGVDLVGAAAGCALVVGVLALVDAPSATLVAAALGAGAGALFAPGPKLQRAGALLAGGLLLGSGLSAAMEPPLLRPVWVKGEFEDYGSFSWVGWNSHSRISVSQTELKYPMHYGATPIAPEDALAPRPQRTVKIDGKAETRIFESGFELEGARWADWDTTAFVHRIRPEGPAAVIGVGGGRDVIAAARSGHDPVVGVELNGLIAGLHSGPMKEFSGLLQIPALELHVDEARGFLAREDRRFSVIAMSFIDTWAAGGAGAYSLSENALYTVEGFVTCLDRLEDDGIFTVSRWFFPELPGETARMLSVTVEALFRRGVTAPREHIAILGTGRFSTLLVSPSPFSERDKERIVTEARTRGLEPLVFPGLDPQHPLLAGVLGHTSSDGLAAWAAEQDLDLSPSTDDKPFFFNMIRPGKVLSGDIASEGMDMGFLGNLQATRTLIQAGFVSLILTVLAIVLPLWPRRRDLTGWGPTTLATAIAYFALIGVGFMFVEIGLLSRLGVLLGHPTLALAVLLGGVIFFAGIGSLMSGRLDPTTSAGRLFPLLPAGLALAVSLVLDPVQAALTPTSVAVRVVAGLALVGVPALGMGVCFPLGLRLIGAARPEGGADLGPWVWAINGACGVCASALALGSSLVWGISRTLQLGAVCYVALTVCAALLSMRTRPTVEADVPSDPASG